jgi:hypothetical protein
MRKPLGEHFPHASHGFTKEIAYMQDQSNMLTSTGQVFHHSLIAAVEAGGRLLTQRTQRVRRSRGDVEHQLILVPLYLGQL